MLEKQNVPSDEDMLPEYHFDYREARPNRFAADVEEGSMVIVLEPDISRAFRSPESVKAILRAIAGGLSEQMSKSPSG
jgi:hypothetical protein